MKRMTKRITALVIAAIMLASMIPAAFAATGEETAEPAYNFQFNRDSHNVTSAKDTTQYTLDNTNDGYDRWGYINVWKRNTTQVTSSGYSYGNWSISNKSFGYKYDPDNNVFPVFMALEIFIDQPGTYTPCLEWVEHEYSPYVDLYLIKAPTDEEEVATWKTALGSQTDPLKEKCYKALSGVAPIGTVKMQPTTDGGDESGKVALSTVTITKNDVGSYYLIFVPNGASEKVASVFDAKTSGIICYIQPKSFSLTRVPLADSDAETIDNTISYIVRAEDSANNGKITVSDEAYEGIGKVGEWTVGESFTATATGSDFAYWANGNGTPVSESASYTFTPTSNFTLEAVYAPADTTTKKVQFWNYNKVYLDEVTAEGDTLGDKMIADPSLNGWNFDKWTTNGSDEFGADTILKAAITRVVAQFTEKDKPFTVDGTTYSYDDAFSKTVNDVSFSYWTINDQIASYDTTLSFNVWNSVEVEAVYEGAKTAVPTVVLDKVNADEYFIHYEVPAGYTPKDAGIVFSEKGTPSVESADSKASVKSAGAKGQFTAAPGDDSHTVARGYVMYEDSFGNLRVLYTDGK